MELPVPLILVLAWVAFAIAALVWGTALAIRLLDEEECLPRGSVGPWLLLSAAVAASLAWWLRPLDAISLSVVFAVPVGVALAWAVSLRLGERAWRRREFGWSGGTPIRQVDGSELRPTFAKWTSAYLTTGPASGYALYSLELFDERGRIARNGYVHRGRGLRDVDRLLAIGCKLLDAQVVWQAAPTVLYSCPLDPWSELLCGRPGSMSEEDQRFWGQWIRPRFPAGGSAEVETARLRSHLSPLLEADPRRGACLERLLDMAGPTVRIMTSLARGRLDDELLGASGRKVLTFEDGLAKVVLEPGPR